MHKGWWAGVAVVAVLLALGAAAHYSTRDAAGDEPPSTELEDDPGLDLETLLPQFELMLVPADALGALSEEDLDEATCARVCAVAGEGEGVVGGRCSAPLRIAGSLDGEDGRQLVMGVPPESVPGAYAYLAAGERRLLIVAAERCTGAGDDPEPPTADEEPGEVP